MRVEAGRRVVPTELGVTLIKGYQLIDAELCRPQVGRHHLFRLRGAGAEAARVR